MRAWYLKQRKLREITHTGNSVGRYLNMMRWRSEGDTWRHDGNAAAAESTAACKTVVNRISEGILR
jgi:hypothetical protein